MADFRRSIPVLAVLALLMLGTATTASAQATTPFSCFANAAVPPIVRAEGITELVGDVLLRCTGGIPTAPGVAIPPVNVQIFLNTNVTSKLVGGSSILTEALLLLDDPRTGTTNPTQAPCLLAPSPCTNIGNGLGNATATTPNYYVGQGTGTNLNVFQGEVAPGRTDSILWRGVPIDPPGTSGERIIRITNVRAHAAGLGTGASPVSIVQTVTATGTFSIPISNPNPVVAVIQKSLTFTVSGAPTNLQQCFSQTNRLVGTLSWTELTPAAFKKYNVGSSAASPTTAVAQNDYTPSFNTETGFYNPAFPSTNGLNVAGLPGYGTRLQAVFRNIPSGVTLTAIPTVVTGTVPGSSPSVPTIDIAHLITSATGSYAAASSGVITPDASGTATIIYEIVQSDASSFTSIRVPVSVSYTANPGANSPPIGPTATVNGSYAPISTVFTAAASPVPRFVDTSTAVNMFSINACVTNLLFPFVTNQVGFDTGLAISSTSTDPFGTSPQGGTCSLNWYGANEPAVNPTVTPIVPSRTTYVNTASSLAPNFQGYMIAQCRFQFGHGFAFVSDFGAKNIAMGYLALIIPDPARAPFPFPCANAAASPSIAGCVPSGEQLGQ